VLETADADRFPSFPGWAQALRADTVEALLSAAGPVSDRLRLLGAAPGDLRLVGEIERRQESFSLVEAGRSAGALTLERSRVPAGSGEGATRWTIRSTADEGGGARSGQAVMWPAAMTQALGPELGRIVLRSSPAEPSFRWLLRARGFEPELSPDLGSTAVVPGLTTGEAAFAVLRRHAASFLRNEPGTRVGDDAEYLHDMRVATRRMRAALRLFDEALPPAATARLREALRSVARALGEVRDLDVQIEQLRGYGSELLTVPPEALEPFFARLCLRREEARRALLEQLEGRAFRRLTASLILRLRRGPAGQLPRAARPPAADLPVVETAPRLIGRAHRRFRRAGDRIDSSSPPADYHKLRIRGKRFRYALEFLEPLYGAPARSMITELVALQDLLGLHQDTQVSMPLVREAISSEPPLPGDCLAALGELVHILARHAEELRRGFPRAYRRLRGKRWRRWKKAARAAAAAAEPAPPLPVSTWAGSVRIPPPANPSGETTLAPPPPRATFGGEAWT
jgi:CHAD domain-containing protein